MASRSGITLLVLVGLVALGSSPDTGCQNAGSPPPGAEPGSDDDFSFEPAPGATTTETDTGTGTGEENDFSFEPAPGATTDTGTGTGEENDFSFEPAPGATTETDTGTGTDDDYSFAPESDEGSGAGDLASCNDVVVAQSASGPVDVPADTGFFHSSESVACEMDEGIGDEDAVAVLQDALVRCNGQNVSVDGGYGPQTRQAVMNIQQQHGLAADGSYGPATLQAMQWPINGGGGCAGGVSASAG